MRFLRLSSVMRLFVSLVFLFPLLSVAQKKTTEFKSTEPSVTQLNQGLVSSLQRFADSTLQIERHYLDSLVVAIALQAKMATARIDVLADSLIMSAQDSLDASRKDTLRIVKTLLQERLLTFYDSTKQAIVGPVSRFVGELTRGKKSYAVCDSCESVEDFRDRFEQFRDFADNLRDLLRDTTSTFMDDRFDTLQDRYETIRDSLADLRSGLIDGRLNEIDYQRYAATRVTVSAGYSSRATYRGRDNGVQQQMFAPSVGFHHQSGFGVEVSTYWLDQTPKRWDDVTATVNYEFAIGGLFGGQLSYSHFWFSDSSKSAKSVFKNAFDASLSLNWPVIAFFVDGDLATGDGSEFTLAVSASHEFEIPLTLSHKISIEPTLTATIGEQNSELTTLRKAPKGRRVVGVQTQTSSTFGILDYEVSLPVTIDLGPLTISPSVNYIMPINVIDLSTKDAFVNFEFGVSLAFH